MRKRLTDWPDKIERLKKMKNCTIGRLEDTIGTAVTRGMLPEPNPCLTLPIPNPSLRSDGVIVFSETTDHFRAN